MPHQKKGENTMGKTVYYNHVPGTPLTDAQKKEIEEASKMPIVFDEDCPELSDEMIKAMKAAVRQRDRHKITN